MTTHTKDLRVGVAQIGPSTGAMKENLDLHLDQITRARDRGLDLIVFPELSLSGYPNKCIDFHANALVAHGDEIQQLAKACEGITAVVGLLEETVAAQFYNASYALRDGEVKHIHRKLNLATYGGLEEGKYFAQGRYVESFELGGWWRAAILICADLWNPALVHLAALHGTTVLIAPTNSARAVVSSRFSNPSGWDLTSRFYAMMYGMPIIMANRVGAEQDLRFWGGSRVIDPFGRALVEAEDDENLLEATLTYDAVRDARLQLPTVRDSNLSLVYRELSRLQHHIGVPESVRKP